jgi:hypothetical protein
VLFIERRRRVVINVEKAEVELSETTVRALLKAIIQAKETIDFVNEPMPQGDMSVYQYKVASRERGNITVSSKYSGITYKVRVETRPHSQEGLGYELDEIPEPETTSCPEGFTLLGSSDDVEKENN